MRRDLVWRLLNPFTYLKLVASGIALIANAVEISEISDADGFPIRGQEQLYRSLARLISKEGSALRHHVGVGLEKEGDK